MGQAHDGGPSQPSEIVEFTQAGQFVGEFSVDSSGEGDAFRIAVYSYGPFVTFAAVDDIVNALDVWQVHT